MLNKLKHSLLSVSLLLFFGIIPIYSTPVATANTITNSPNTQRFNQIIPLLTAEDFAKANDYVESKRLSSTEEKNAAVREFLVQLYNQPRKESYRRPNRKTPNAQEKKLIASHPWEATHYYTATIVAENYTYKRFGYNGFQESSDAFRHAMWNALLAQRLGAGRAKVWADAHEANVRDHLDKQMDLHNNNLGRTIGSKYGRHGTATVAMSNEIYRAIKSGRGRMIIARRLVPTR